MDARWQWPAQAQGLSYRGDSLSHVARRWETEEGLSFSISLAQDWMEHIITKQQKNGWCQILEVACSWVHREARGGNHSQIISLSEPQGLQYRRDLWHSVGWIGLMWLQDRHYWIQTEHLGGTTFSTISIWPTFQAVQAWSLPRLDGKFKLFKTHSREMLPPPCPWAMSTTTSANRMRRCVSSCRCS